MVGHLLLFHPALASRARADRLGRARRASTTSTATAQNLGKVRADENALWSLGAHDVAVLLDLVGERPVEAQARGECYVRPGIEDVVFGYLKFPSGVDRAPAPELARPAQDAQADGRRLAEDGRVRRHGDRPQGHDLRQERVAAAAAPTPTASTSSVRFGDISIPRIAERRAAAARVPGVRRRHPRGARAALQRARGPRRRRGARGDAGVARRRAAASMQAARRDA